jgi:hypothetical protein
MADKITARITATTRRVFDSVAETARLNGMRAEVREVETAGSFKETKLHLVINDIDMMWYFAAIPEREQLSAWRSEPNGKVRIKISSPYGGRPLLLPERSDGTHDYGRALAACLPVLSALDVQRRAEANRKAGRGLAEALRVELGACGHTHELHNGMAIRPSAASPEEVELTFHFQMQVTPDEARRIAAGLLALGVHTPDDH